MFVIGDDRPIILVVEDEFFIASYLEVMLEKAGFQVLGPAKSVGVALHLLSQTTPQAAVLDVKLVGETSLSVATVLNDMGVPYLVSSSMRKAELDAMQVLEGRRHVDKLADWQVLARSLNELLGRA